MTLRRQLAERRYPRSSVPYSDIPVESLMADDDVLVVAELLTRRPGTRTPHARSTRTSTSSPTGTPGVRRPSVGGVW